MTPLLGALGLLLAGCAVLAIVGLLDARSARRAWPPAEYVSTGAVRRLRVEDETEPQTLNPRRS